MPKRERKIANKHVQDIVSLTPLQEGMLFHYLENPEQDYYCEQLTLHLTGPLDIEKVHKTWQHLVARNEVLRSIFRWKKLQKPIRIVLRDWTVPLDYHDLTNLSTGDQKSYWQTIQQNDRAKRFDLEKEPFRVTIMEQTNENWIMIISYHHILYDGWSNGILLKEFLQTYQALCKKEEIPTRPKTPFKEFVKWLHNQDQAALKEYWQKYLADVEIKKLLPEINSPLQKTGEKSKSQIHQTLLKPSLLKAVMDFAQTYKVTPAILLYVVWGILLQRYNNTNDVIFGTPVAGRNLPLAGVDEMVGLFINTIPLRIKGDGEEEVLAVLKRVQQELKVRTEYEQLPLVEIQHLSNHGQSLFDSIFVIENYPLDKKYNETNNLIKISDYSIQESTNYDLTLTAEISDQLLLQFAYQPAKLSLETIERMSEHFTHILTNILHNPTQQIGNIEMLSEPEKKTLCQEFSHRFDPEFTPRTINQLLMERVKENPDGLAVVYEDAELTYRELDHRSSQLAQTLQQKGVQKETVVGIISRRSLDMIVGILAIIKAGGAYLPIGPELPSKRIEYMLEDSGAKICLLQDEFTDLLGDRIPTVHLEDEKNYVHLDQMLEETVPQNLAYVIYTSGSTGKPKGVMVEQASVIGLVEGLREIVYQRFTTPLQVALVAPYYFDASVQQIFSTLLLGHTLHIVPEDVRLQGSSLLDFYHQHQIDISDGTPIHLRLLADTPRSYQIHLSVKHFLIGGEALSQAVIRDFYARFAPATPLITNVYGPTECCVDSTAYLIQPDQLPEMNTIPIGRPLMHEQIYILNKDLQLQPQGALGEIYISGVGVGRGYVNNPALTQERFIPNPYLPGQRMYRTGDQARWLGDGNIQFVGRVDHQVKIRGFRIETGEIEQQLLRYEPIRTAVVLARKEAGQYSDLVAYLVAEKDVSTEEVREFLLRHLPDYMIPTYFVQLEQMPLTPNGKLDRSALPEPEVSSLSNQYVAPENPTEESLVRIWSELLQVEKVGVLDSFFALGGHSLKATMLSSRIHKEFDVQIPVREIFNRPRIRELADYIQRAGQSIYESIEKVTEREYYPVSSAQKRMYLLQQYDLASVGYNMTGGVALIGQVDLQRVREVFKQLMERHETLRTVFLQKGEEIVQKILPTIPLAFEVEDQKRLYLDPESDPTRWIKEFVRPFDLETGPLFRIKIIRGEKERSLLLLDMHHIISDGISLELMISEFTTLYQQGELPKLPIQYKDVAVWQQNLLASGRLKDQAQFWFQRFQDELPVLQLPTDYPPQRERSFAGQEISLTLAEEITAGLEKLARETDSTLYMVLLAGVNILLAKYSGQEDIIVGTPVAGRPHADLDRIIGVFVNTLAIRMQPSGDKSYLEFLAEVREETLLAFENQDYPFEELVDRLELARDQSRNPLFDVLFAFEELNMADKWKLDDVICQPITFQSNQAKFDLAITAERRESLSLNFTYRTQLFNEQTIQRMLQHLEQILSAIIVNPQIKMKDISLLTPTEREEILQFSQGSQRWEEESLSIVDVFKEQVRNAPQRVALVACDEQLTYEELDQRATNLAVRLQDIGVGLDHLVGIISERNLDLVVGILGILQAGAGYVPIGPDFPKARIEFMLEDSGASACLLQREFTDLGLDQFVPTLILDSRLETPVQPKRTEENDGEPMDAVQVKAENLAYAIYTSGSTGNPKGVLIEQTSVLSLVRSLKELIYQKYATPLQVALVAPYYFDASVQQIFGALLLGHTLHIVPEEARLSGKSLLAFYQKNQIDLSDGTPVHLRLLSEAPLTGKEELPVQHFLIGGEALSQSVVREVYNRFKNAHFEITNVYGPTECCVDSTAYFVTKDQSETIATVPIGHPLPNEQVYILDPNLQLQPKGVMGEIYIAGAGVGRGYLNNPELTVEKFIPNPFQPGEKMYRTGDLGRWRNDGSIEFLGRRDHQVKIRGFRIETEEIRQQLVQFALIREAVVMDREDPTGDKYLCAYLIGEGEVTPAEIRQFLLTRLPEYMIPAHFVLVDQFPLTPNGKLDRKALPVPAFQRKQGEEYVAPTTELEVRLAQIWSELLGIETIGVEDDFFALGGHSLRATILVGKIYRKLGVEVPLRRIFNTPTIRELARYIEEQQQSHYQPIEKVKKAPYYPVASPQKRMYLLQQFEPKSSTYNIPSALEIRGQLDLQRVEEVFCRLIQRHETLRTSFETRGDQIVQKIHSDVEFGIERLELPGLLEAAAVKENESAAREFDDLITSIIEELGPEFVRPFDLNCPPLMRVGVLNLAPDWHLLLLDLHHIISDGTSMGILIRDFAALYGEQELPAPRLQYKDVAVWQEDLLKGEMIQAQKQYWLDRFANEIPVLNLPTDFPRPRVLDETGDMVEWTIDQELTQKIKALGAQNQSTLYMTLLAGINLLLARYSGQEDIVVGSPIAGRSHPDVQEIIGVFVNTLALRNQPQGDQTFAEFLQEVKGNALKAYENQDYPFEELVENLHIQRELNRSPLFDVMFTMQNMEQEPFQLPELTVMPPRQLQAMAKFDLTIYAEEVADQIRLQFEFSPQLFTRERMGRMQSHLEQILRRVTAEPEIRLREIELITPGEKEKILYGFNQTQRQYPHQKTIMEIFAEQVEKVPEQKALVFAKRDMTYRELNKRVNYYAARLRQQGVKRDSIVGLMAQRSLEMVLGVLAILKAGGAYLPIDPDYPAERVQLMLEDAGAEILLSPTDEQVMGAEGCQMIPLTIESENMSDTVPIELENINQPTDLAYVIYTSGSTGRPKGVMATHQNVLRLVLNTNFVQFRPDDRILQTGTLAFDASTFEIWGALLNGLELHLAEKDLILSPERMGRYLEEAQISMLFLTTPLFNLLAEESPQIFQGLRYLLTGGDIMLPQYAERVRKACPKMQLLNVYGPTENTTFSTYFPVEREYQTNIPIGKPIANSTAVILDTYGQICPVGVYGELCVGGDGLARGYLNRPTLTGEKFIPHPHLAGETIYRTGDLARWLADGNIEFFGRVDDQVKIRGFRIELGEIENRLITHPLITETVVMADSDDQGSKYLTAYVVAEEELVIEELRSFLAESLPDYMVPGYLIQLAQLPLLENGKIDRNRLPRPEGQLNTQTPYVAPRDQLETGLARLWSQILNVETVGIDDDFFAMGGHSLKATILASRIHEQFEVEIPLRQLFQHSTIRQLAEVIRGLEKEHYSTIEPVGKAPYYPASPAQKRMYLLQQISPASTGYNLPNVLEVRGELDWMRVKAAFQELMNRQESLRTSFARMGEEIIQKIQPDLEPDLAYLEMNQKEKTLSPQEIQPLIQEWIQPFDLGQAPLFKVRIIQLAKEHHLLFFDMHHIISDGMSMEILVEEFAALYGGEALEEMRIQYRDFAVWQEDFLQSARLQQQANYWQERLQDEIPVLNLPTDFSRPRVQNFDGDEIDFFLDQGLVAGLKELALKTESTLYMVLLSALNILLAKYSGQEDIMVGSPIAGRHHPDLASIIGMFVNTLVMRNQPMGLKPYQQFLQEVKENALAAYENQDYQFEALVEDLEIKRDLSRNPLFDVLFVMQNVAQSQLQADGLEFLPYELRQRTVKFDLTFAATELAMGMRLSIGYNTSLFKKETIQQMATHLQRILQAITTDAKVPIQEINLLDDAERKKIVRDFNQTQQPTPEKETLVQHFWDQVQRNPERIAVTYGDQHLTFTQLNGRANLVARKLQEKGIRPDQIVGVMMERSLEMMVGILGILQAGGAYLPLSPTYPAERVNYLIQDSQTELVLAQGRYSSKLASVTPAVEVLALDEWSWEYDLDSEEKLPVTPPISGSNLAYVIYTSGSTGNPKGVLVEHRSVVNILANLENDYPLEVGDTYLLKTAYTFDVSVTELFGWIMGQGQLSILPPGEEKDVQALLKRIEESQVTHINFVPSMLHLFIDEMTERDRERIQHLKYIFVAGEAFTVALAQKCVKWFKHQRVENIYGPTEATIYSTRYSLAKWQGVGSIPIGRPLNNIQAYILDQYNQPVPIGVRGELCIGGLALTRGYLNRGELTAKKFVPNPFRPGEKMYQTGDVARWLPDGNIEYLGRMDHQVKIRGFRIEPGEIEYQLLQAPAVKEGVVVDLEDEEGNKYLCAYLTAERTLTVGELREYLLENLPEYMIPDYFVQLEELPLNTNGKLDRKRLPQPTENLTLGSKYKAPTNQLESALVGIWQRILGVEEVGIGDKFFELGGHSLKAVQLVSEIQKELDVELSLSEIFKRPTIEELARHMQHLDETIYTAIQPAQEREYYPLSSAQKRIYLQCQMGGNEISYNMPGGVWIEGELDLTRLEQVLEKLVERHESLRTSFELREKEVVQLVWESVQIPYSVVKTNEEEQEGLIQQFVQPFDLRQAPLLRVQLLQFSTTRSLLLFDLHHIIADGISLEILIHDFVHFYQGESLEPLPLQYKDVAVWQEDPRTQARLQKEEQFWLETLAGELPVLDLAFDQPRPAVQSFVGDRLEWVLEGDYVLTLQEYATSRNGTMFMLLLSAYYALLYRYTGAEDIIVGSPIAGRNHPDLQQMMGMFVNMLALRNEPTGTKSFQQFFAEVRERVLLAYDHQGYPFEELVEKLEPNRDLSRNPLFDLVFSMENSRLNAFTAANIRFTPVDLQTNTAKFDLTLDANVKGNQIILNFEYCTELFTHERIKQMAEHYQNILQEIGQNPTQNLGEIELLSPAEKRLLLTDFNQTEMVFPKEKTLQELFTDQVWRTPTQIAIVDGEKEYSYEQLNRMANGLAYRLHRLGVERETIVGIMAHRSLEMLVGILGILKAGGAYLPIDPDYPSQRIEYILKDSGAPILLTLEHDHPEIDYQGQRFELGAELAKIEAGTQDVWNLEIKRTPQDLAYLIYTSGSTGKPKGVMIEEQGVISLAFYYQQKFALGPGKNILHMSNVSFDTSVVEIFPPLISGATIFIIPKEELLDAQRFEQFVRQNQIHFVQFVPLLLKEILGKVDRLETLETVIVGGDALNLSLQEQILALGYPLTNHYGPTETTVDAIVADTKPGKVTIGRPIANTQIYILDTDHQPTPLGVPGEICIAGIGLARGYLNRPDLTAEKFIPNPFQPGTRLYKTGDIGFWQQDGSIVIMGRKDHQLKIRGYRIEPGEIEAALLTYEPITEAVVMAHQDQHGAKYLVAYLTAQLEVSSEVVREYVQTRLPEYMIPTHFIQLSAMPMNAHGKIQRNQLPSPDGFKLGNREYVAPSNEIEAQLAQIWSDVLEIDQIGVLDHFFELGGHSLKATILSAKIQKEFHVEISLVQIFQNPTLKEMSELIQHTARTTFEVIEKVGVKENYPVSSAQKRMYLLQQLDIQGLGYNMPGVFKLQGQLDEKRVEEVFISLIERHETLHTSFAMVDGEIVQKIHSNVEFGLEILLPTEDGVKQGAFDIEQDQADIDEIIQGFIRPFDLHTAPLFRVGLIPLTDELRILIFDIHHIIGDGASINILMEEFATLYTGRELEPLTVQYKDVAVWQGERLRSYLMARQETYWLETFAGEVPVLQLPTDHPRPHTPDFTGERLEVILDQRLAQKLHQVANQTETTLYMVLLAGINILLARYSGQEDIVVGSPISGRSHPELIPMIGNFVNTLAMRNQPTLTKTCREFLTEVRENALAAYKNQDYPFEELVENLQLQRSISRNPLFDVLFVMQNMDQRELHLENLMIQPYPYQNNTAKLDLAISAREEAGKIVLEFEYATSLFKKATIRRMGTHLVNLLGGFGNLKTALQDLSLLSDVEREQLLVEWNQTTRPYPKDARLEELFSLQVARSPEAIAIVGAGEAWTYADLEKRANQLARQLRKVGVKRETIVGIMTERSPQMLVGIFATLKAGGAYLPINPTDPVERIRFLLADSQAKIVLTQHPYQHLVDRSEQKLINMDDPENYTADQRELLLEKASTDMAYIIYTSGSTGKPKGVIIQHQSVVNILSQLQRDYPISEEGAYLLKTTYTFDVSVTELFGWFMGGGRIALLPPGGEKEISTILKTIEDYKVTHVNFVPSMLQVFLQGLREEEVGRLASLRYLLVAGEAFPSELVRVCREKLPHVQLENIYGPTETTIYATRYSTVDYSGQGVVPIGRPMQNIQAYILSPTLQLQPIGVPGELGLSGEALARGYLNRRELTAEKFVPHPFLAEKTMYKTGDLARWLPDGTIEYLGRIDDQVKIRGFRIEPGEVEAELATYPAIDQAVVVAKTAPGGDKYLCGYFTTDEEIETGELRSHLLQELPEYMVPSYFVHLESIPLNQNGKVDRKALPEPTDVAMIEADYEPPTNTCEERLIAIWEEILQMDGIGIGHNFFELGGHSLKAVQITNRIQKEFHVQISIYEFFQALTIKELAQKIAAGEVNTSHRQDRVGFQDDFYPITYNQKRLWILHQLDSESTAYHMSGRITLPGAVDPELIRHVFIQLMERHESLRTYFKIAQGRTGQMIDSDAKLKFAFYDLSANSGEIEEKRDECFQEISSKPFDLKVAPLFRVGLVRLNDQESDLIFCMHHIISDGWSIEIMKKEFQILYRAASEGRKGKLEPLTVQYKDFAVQQQKYLANSSAVKAAREFWHQKLQRGVPELNLPEDFPADLEKSKQGASYRIVILEELKEKLKEVARENNTSLYVVLTTLLTMYLAEITGQEEIGIGLPSSGRKDEHLHNVIGFFVNTVVLLNRVQPGITFEELVKKVNYDLLFSLEYQDYPLELIVEELGIKYPRIQVFFNMLNLGESHKEELQDLSTYHIPDVQDVKFDIMFYLTEYSNGIEIYCNYLSNLYKKTTIEYLVQEYIEFMKRTLGWGDEPEDDEFILFPGV